MKGYKAYNVTLKAITPIVLTQRENQQMISGIDFDIEDKQVKWVVDHRSSTLGQVKDESKISTIYPAYFNGNSYYIPGSTIKGNMMKRVDKKTREQWNKVSNLLNVRDFMIEHTGAVKVENVKKVTQLKNNKEKKSGEELRKINFYEQFHQVGYEVIQKGTVVSSKIQVQEKYSSNIKEYIKQDAFLKEWKKQYELYLKPGYFGEDKEAEEQFNQLLQNTETLINDGLKNGELLIAIGGYRGYCNAFEDDEEMPGVYFQDVDQEESAEKQSVILGFASIQFQEVE